MERRSSERIDAGVPAELDTATEQGHAGILQDVSDTGALLLSRVALKTDEELLVRFRAAGRDAELEEVRATVVRSEPNDAESVWPIRSALEFGARVTLDRDALSDP